MIVRGQREVGRRIQVCSGRCASGGKECRTVVLPSPALGASAQAETVRRDSADALLAKPYFISHAWLRIDPTWAPLTGDPRFERRIAHPTPGATQKM